MGASKASLFTDQHNKIAIYMKALAHPARVAICDHLLHTTGATAVEMQEVIPLSYPSIIQHLKVLRKSHLVDGFLKNGAVAYQLNASCFSNIQQFCDHFLSLLPPEKEDTILPANRGPVQS